MPTRAKRRRSLFTDPYVKRRAEIVFAESAVMKTSRRFHRSARRTSAGRVPTPIAVRRCKSGRTHRCGGEGGGPLTESGRNLHGGGTPALPPRPGPSTGVSFARASGLDACCGVVRTGLRPGEEKSRGAPAERNPLPGRPSPSDVRSRPRPSQPPPPTSSLSVVDDVFVSRAPETCPSSPHRRGRQRSVGDWIFAGSAGAKRVRYSSGAFDSVNAKSCTRHIGSRRLCVRAFFFFF